MNKFCRFFLFFLVSYLIFLSFFPLFLSLSSNILRKYWSTTRALHHRAHTIYVSMRFYHFCFIVFRIFKYGWHDGDGGWSVLPNNGKVANDFSLSLFFLKQWAQISNFGELNRWKHMLSMSLPFNRKLVEIFALARRRARVKKIQVQKQTFWWQHIFWSFNRYH